MTVDGLPVATTARVSKTLLQVTLASLLSQGPHTVTVTNFDKQTASATLTISPPPTIDLPPLTGVRYFLENTSPFLTIHGSNFAPGAKVTVGGVAAQASVVTNTASQIKVLLPATLAAGGHIVTVTNPDGQQADAPFTVAPAPSIAAAGLTAITAVSGNTTLIVSGENFVYSDSNCPGFTAGVTVNGVFIAANSKAATASGSRSITQMTVPLGTRFPGGRYSVVVTNPDGQSSDGTSAAPHALGSFASQPRAATSSNTVNVFSSDQTHYRVAATNTGGGLLNAIIGFFTNLFFSLKSMPNAAPTQTDITHSTALEAALSIFVQAQNGGVGTGLIANDGGSLIANDGGSLIANDGGSLISNDGASLIANDGGSLIANDGGSLRANVGGSLRSRLVNQAGSTGVTIFGLVAAVDNANAPDNSLAIFNTTAPSIAHALAPRASATNTPATFDIIKHDQLGAGTGSSDLTVTSQDANGNTVVLLQLRFTPGRRDVLLYKAPGISLTPLDGTPAPLHPGALLRAVAAARNPDGTLTVTLENDGAAPATNVTLTPARTKFGGQSLGGPLPAPLASLASGATATFNLHFPPGAGGSAVQVAATYSGLNFTTILPVK